MSFSKSGGLGQVQRLQFGYGLAKSMKVKAEKLVVVAE
jgi:hypothetical protein